MCCCVCAPSSSQTCKVLDCAVAPVVHIIMENGSKAPKAIRMAPEGAPNPQGLALYVITEEIIVSLPALTHRQRGMIKRRERGRGGGGRGGESGRRGDAAKIRTGPPGGGRRERQSEPQTWIRSLGRCRRRRRRGRGKATTQPTSQTRSHTHVHTRCRCNVIKATQRISLVSSRKLKQSCITERGKGPPSGGRKDVNLFEKGRGGADFIAGLALLLTLPAPPPFQPSPFKYRCRTWFYFLSNIRSCRLHESSAPSFGKPISSADCCSRKEGFSSVIVT